MIVNHMPLTRSKNDLPFVYLSDFIFLYSHHKLMIQKDEHSYITVQHYYVDHLHIQTKWKLIEPVVIENIKDLEQAVKEAKIIKLSSRIIVYSKKISIPSREAELLFRRNFSQREWYLRQEYQTSSPILLPEEFFESLIKGLQP